MRLRNLIKTGAKGFFGLFGLDVVSKNRVVIPPVDTLKHNTEEGLDQYWADPANKAYWDAPEAHGFYKELIDRLRKSNIDLDSKTIADIGCGNGLLLTHICRHFKPAEIFGYEFSKSALAQAEKWLPQGHFVYHDIMNAIDRQFDFIFCTEVLEHILEAELAFRNIIAVIKSSGGGIITIPNGRTDTSTRHINFWSPESWEQFCRKNLPDGFTCSHSQWGPLLVTIVKRNKE